MDLNRHAGTWYEIARFPDRCEGGSGATCLDAMATCTPRPDRGGHRPCGGRQPWYEAARHLFRPFRGGHWVPGLDPGYHWAVMGDPRREYPLPVGDHAEAVDIAHAQGFDIGRLEPTPQSGI